MNGRRSRAVRRGLALALTAKPAALGLAVLAPRVASAANVAVACNDIPGLRTAITNANAATGTISLAANCTYNLTTADPTTTTDGLPLVTGTMTIEGNGATITRDNAAPNFRIFGVSSTGDLTLDHLTVSNGVAAVANSGGGGIWNDQGILTVTNSTISGNKATSGQFTAKGGGILSSGTTTITDSVISGNVVTLSSSTNVEGAGGIVASGGGIAAKGGTLKVSNTTITQNTVTATATSATGAARSASALGGGIAANGALNDTFTGPTVTISGSTLSANTTTATSAGTGTATAAGGAVEQKSFGAFTSLSATLSTTIINSTLAGNSTTTSPAGADIGGAISMDSQPQSTDTLVVINSTVAGNSASKGAIAKNGNGTETLTNTILSGNTGLNCNGTIADGGHNISFPATDATCINTFGQGDPNLGSLAANGGTTQTMALGTGSAAIDTANNTVCQAAPPAGAGGIDQRGLPRAEVTADTTCDIGAFEVQAVVAPSPSPVGLPAAGQSVPQDPGGSTPWPLLIPPIAAGAALAGIASRRWRRAQ
jgi:hypothetical protein